MATRLNQAASTEHGSAPTLAGSTSAAGFRGSVSDLKKPAAVIGDGISLSGKTLTIEKDGAVLDGVDLRGIGVRVEADNVTIKNSFGLAAAAFAIHQAAGHEGLTVEHCTFDGQKADVASPFISSDTGTVTVRNNEFFDVPADVINAMGGVENNNVAGHADLTGSHPETVPVHEPVSVGTATESTTTAMAQPSVEPSLDPTSTASVAHPTETAVAPTVETTVTQPVVEPSQEPTSTGSIAHPTETAVAPTTETAAAGPESAIAGASEQSPQATEPTSAEATTSASPVSAEASSEQAAPGTSATADPAAPTTNPADAAPSQPVTLDPIPNEASGAASGAERDHRADTVHSGSKPADAGHGHGPAAGHGHDHSPVHGEGDTFVVPPALESLLSEIRDMLSSHTGGEHGTGSVDLPQGDTGGSPEHGFIWFELESFLAKIGHLNEHLQNAAATVEAPTATLGHVDMNKVAPGDHDLLL